MVQKDLVVINESGLHARPAGLLVKAASKFKSNITILYQDKNINVKSLLNVLSAGIASGSKITLVCEGEDEQEALKTLTELIESGLGE
ncbi:MAG: HPr family phosphocarrier protein [Epulopiscium sp.]|nr:HPr family phosphocarrier protein [Candidatus Epulonipiscium sp.]